MLYFYKQIMRVFHFIIREVFLTILERVEKGNLKPSFLNKKEEGMETFQEIINGDKPVLVDFFCHLVRGYCKAMSSIVESVGKEAQGKARVFKVDIDKNPAVAAQYGIQAVPTVILFKQGKIIWKNVGVTDKMDIFTFSP